MQNPFSKVLEKIIPFIGLGIIVVVGIVGLIIFSYILIWGAVVGFIIFIIALIRQRFTTHQDDKSKSNRIIEHDDID